MSSIHLFETRKKIPQHALSNINNTSSKNTKLVSPIKSSLFENSLKLQTGLNSSLDFLDNSNIFKTQFDFIEPKQNLNNNNNKM